MNAGKMQAIVMGKTDYDYDLKVLEKVTLDRKLESGNHYALKTLLNMGKAVDYDTVLKMASLRSLEQRRFERSLIMFTFFKDPHLFQTFLKYGLRVINLEILV